MDIPLASYSPEGEGHAGRWDKGRMCDHMWGRMRGVRAGGVRRGAWLCVGF
jgi:hypothetical protein